MATLFPHNATHYNLFYGIEVFDKETKKWIHAFDIFPHDEEVLGPLTISATTDREILEDTFKNLCHDYPDTQCRKVVIHAIANVIPFTDDTETTPIKARKTNTKRRKAAKSSS